MSEPCKHEREFAGTQRDTLTSFVKTSGALVEMQAERDVARATVARVKRLCDEVADEVTGIQAELVDDIRAALTEPTS